MKILVINAGSSSLKYQVIDMENEEVLAKGNCERVGAEDSCITHKTASGVKIEKQVSMPNHTAAFFVVQEQLTSGEGKVLESMSEIGAVGHRVVQGGAIFSKSVLVDEDVLAKIEELSDLAPLHNPAHVQGIRACVECLGPDVPQVAVFDTSFHQTMPKHAYMFALPYEYYEKYQIRRYGFHGSSHRYVSAECIKLLGNKEGSKIITCHLGNGSSLSAVLDGKCIDTTMGLTPLGGFMMGTRTGSLDPSIVTYIMEKEGLSHKELNDLMNKKSGMLGITGISSDNRDVEEAAANGNERAQLGLDMLRYQIRNQIGAYIAALDGVDAIVFTGGIGENGDETRAEILKGFSYMGLKIDDEKNAKARRGVGDEISTPDSTVRVFVIPTDEELVIARDTKALVEG